MADIALSMRRMEKVEVEQRLTWFDSLDEQDVACWKSVAVIAVDREAGEGKAVACGISLDEAELSAVIFSMLRSVWARAAGRAIGVMRICPRGYRPRGLA